MTSSKQRREPADRDQRLLDEAEMLISMLLDDSLDQDGRQRLQQQLESSEAVRSRYLEAMQLHVDLLDHFRPTSDDDAQAKRAITVLSMLGDAVTPLPDSRRPARD